MTTLLKETGEELISLRPVCLPDNSGGDYIEALIQDEKDFDFYLKVRNDPKVWAGFYTQKQPVTVDEHMDWWDSRPCSWYKFIIEVLDIPVGILNIGQTEHWSPETGWAVLSDYWGRGYGTAAVKLALNWLKERGYRYTHTTILKNNTRSLNLVKSLGFEVLGDAREGELWLTKKL